MRSSSGTSRYDRPAHHGRSKAMKTSGAPLPGRLRVRARGQVATPRSRRRGGPGGAPKSGRPSGSSATTSPSTIASGAASQVGGPEQLREVAAGVVAVARPELDLPAGHDRLDPVAVPLRLEEPVVAVERRGPRRRQHRLDEGGLGGDARARRVERGERRRRGRSTRGATPGGHLVVRPVGLHRRRMVLGVPARDRLGAGLGDEEPRVAGRPRAPAPPPAPRRRPPPRVARLAPPSGPA